MSRTCRVCNKLLAIAMFGKNAAIKSGIDTRCRQCGRKATKATKSRRKNGTLLTRSHNKLDTVARLDIMNRALARPDTMSWTMQTETRSIDALMHMMPALEFRRWQDCTKSDVGIRPRSSSMDLWLPLQLKSCDATFVQFRMRGKDKKLPNCDTICIALSRDNTLFFFRKEEIPAMRIAPCGLLGMFNFDHWRGRSINARVLEVELMARWWDEERSFSEGHLRSEVNANHKVELAHIAHANLTFPNSVVRWPCTPQGVTDLIRDGQKEQYKSVQRKGNVFQAGDVKKKLCTVDVAYEVGDNDWYVLGYTDTVNHIELLWRIPEAFMAQKGYLSTRGNDGLFATPGQMSVPLNIVGPNGENKDLQMQIVGKMPRSDVESDTAQFLHVVRL